MQHMSVIVLQYMIIFQGISKTHLDIEIDFNAFVYIYFLLVLR